MRVGCASSDLVAAVLAARSQAQVGDDIANLVIVQMYINWNSGFGVCGVPVF